MGGARLSEARRRGGAVAAAVLLAAGLAGCTGGDPDPEVTAPTFVDAPSSEPAPSRSSEPPASAEPSAAPTQAAPPLPDAATQQTPEGAVAFTEWWFETLNYATATGDTEALRAASDPECTTCNNYAEEIEGAYTQGGNIEGGEFLISADAPGGVEELGIRVSATGSVTRTRILDRDQSVVTEYGEGTFGGNVTLLLSPDGWSMASIGEIE